MRRVWRITGLSLAAAMTLTAEEVQMDTIDVQEAGTTTIVKDVSGDEVRSADLAYALNQLDPDVQLIRRSGISNDIILRGMRKDNINFLVDDGKIYGGCPNRMDPPISHVLASNVANIIIKEGPYDVRHFGTLTGLVSVETLKPQKDLHGRVDLNAGSWDYYKAGAEVSGGNDRIRVLAGGSYEKGGQYKDGDGNTLAEQLADNPAAGATVYQDRYADMDAFEKKTGMAKLFFNVTDNQELRLSYTVNRSEDVLYPNSKMDALKDDSDLFNAKYIVKNLYGDLSKKLAFEFYNSWVYHPMGTYYRKSTLMMKGVGENVMHSRIWGWAVRNTARVAEGDLQIGMEGSERTWKGRYYFTPLATNQTLAKGWSIDHAETDDTGLYAQYQKRVGAFDLDMGLRYDMASVKSASAVTDTNDYNAMGGYLFGTYHLSEDTKFFGGVGSSIRVPDGKELYFQNKIGGFYHGNPDLDKVRNNEIDLGVETAFAQMATLRVKGFYSKYDDFIFFNKSIVVGTDPKTGKPVTGRYENMDATLYGFSLDGTLAVTDTVWFDGGLAWLKGKKDDPLTNQHGTDMPNITPLKGTLGINWDFDDTGTARFWMVAADKWRDYDAENGEQAIDGYAVFNFRVKKDFLNHYELTLGVDNIFDKTYAMTNTYADMILVSGGTDPMLLNEPGRYLYANFTYHF